MEDQMRRLAYLFDMGKLDMECNSDGCHRSPSKEITLFELDTSTRERRGIASLYFCTEHYKSCILSALKTLNSNSKHKIDASIKETGFLTF